MEKKADMSPYSEEYETATPLIASLLWRLPGERPDHLVKQLKSLNAQIRAKNTQAKQKHNEGLIRVEFFTSLSDQIQAAATSAYESNNMESFLDIQQSLQNAITQYSWPENWNIDQEQFADYCDTLANQNGSDALSESTSKDSDEEYHEDVLGWQVPKPLDDIRSEAERKYGIPYMPGPILGWSGDESSGYSLIIGHQRKGRKTARVISSSDLPIDVDNDDMDIKLHSRGLRSFSDDMDYDSKLVSGIGLVAWKVNEKNELDPASSLHPGKNTSYPEMYIWVQWNDNAWTWEDRESFRHIMKELTDLQVDLLLYQLATSQEAKYTEALTGKRPTLPDITPSDLLGRGPNAKSTNFEPSMPARKPPGSHQGIPTKKSFMNGNADLSKSLATIVKQRNFARGQPSLVSMTRPFREQEVPGQRRGRGGLAWDTGSLA